VNLKLWSIQYEKEKELHRFIDMILSFRTDNFVKRIQDKTKIHTIRADKANRWRVGMKIHFWKGNPRNPSKNPYPFELEGEHIHLVQATQKILIEAPKIYIDGHLLCVTEAHSLALNDGFDNLADFLAFFPSSFQGKIIHWTDYVYPF